jgi:uncharacterized protein YchJ
MAHVVKKVEIYSVEILMTSLLNTQKFATVHFVFIQLKAARRTRLQAQELSRFAQPQRSWTRYN